MITYLAGFFASSFVIYWMHRLVHLLRLSSHLDHHNQVTTNTIQGFTWKNVFLFFDSWSSTFDQWLTEVIPVLLISWVTGLWGLIIGYYIWAAFIQERIEHNPDFDWYPFLTSGKWHLVHHACPDKNFGVFHPLWDIIFGTYVDHKQFTRTAS